MQDLRIEKLAKNLINYSVNLKKGENILIEILGEDGIPLGKELIKQAEIIGANPIFNIINYQLLREFLKDASEEQIKLYAKHSILYEKQNIPSERGNMRFSLGLDEKWHFFLTR